MRTDLAPDDPLFEECDAGDQSAPVELTAGFLSVVMAISTLPPVKPVMTVMR